MWKGLKICTVSYTHLDVYKRQVMERLNYAQRLLPQNITPTLGPDGTGVGLSLIHI